MFSFEIIAAVVPVTMSAFVLATLFAIRELHRIALTLLRIGLAGGIYSLLAGFFLLTGWQDPLAQVGAVTAEQHAASGDRMTSFLMLESRTWGVLLIAFGAYMTYLFRDALRHARPPQS
jgi:hypothetical protein